MSLDKAIKYGKEKRKRYYGAASVDRSCRNGGSCPWCQSNRMYKHRRRELSAQEKLNEWKKRTTD